MATARSSGVASALTAALRKADTTPADGALIALAKTYAKQVDAADAATLIKLTPGLLAILEQLGMTPKGRATEIPRPPAGGVPGDSPTARRAGFDQRRARAAARINGTTSLDPAAS